MPREFLYCPLSGSRVFCAPYDAIQEPVESAPGSVIVHTEGIPFRIPTATPRHYCRAEIKDVILHWYGQANVVGYDRQGTVEVYFCATPQGERNGMTRETVALARADMVRDLRTVLDWQGCDDASGDIAHVFAINQCIIIPLHRAAADDLALKTASAAAVIEERMQVAEARAEEEKSANTEAEEVIHPPRRRRPATEFKFEVTQ